MGVNNIGSFFMPKNKIFYELFEEIANTVVEMGIQLKKVVIEPDRDKRLPTIKYIEDLEHRNDDFTHKIFTELGKNFITPFDRADIHYLAIALDDICDLINSSAKKINIYNVNPNDTGIIKMADLIEQGCNEIKVAVFGLRDLNNIKSMSDALVRVNSIENKADDVYDMCIEYLFESESDSKELIKKRDIYQALERATDKCEDAANVIESIIIKYA